MCGSVLSGAAVEGDRSHRVAGLWAALGKGGDSIGSISEGIWWVACAVTLRRKSHAIFPTRHINNGSSLLEPASNYLSGRFNGQFPYLWTT